MTIRTHNILDYILGAALILAPFLFGFSNVYFAHDVFLITGLTLIGYSLLTEYTYSIAKVIPLSMHMVFDLISGAFLALAPAIYNYRAELTGFQYALHFMFAMGFIALVAFTRRGAEPPVAISVPPEEEETFERA